jgi:SAM-dependent methyltransferase
VTDIATGSSPLREVEDAIAVPFSFLMIDVDVTHLVSPKTRTALREEGGALIDDAGNRFPIVNGIPRFVPLDNYTASFGLQWTTFQRQQLDKFSGLTITRDRFYGNSRWKPDELKGQRILEVGSGAGRFTQIVLEAGAEVFSIDYSNAVEANLANNGPHPRLHLYQASVYELPFQHEFFDKIFCYGVLQHTPDPRRSFLGMVPFLKPGGELAVDVYAKTWKTPFWTKYWWRPLTTRLDPNVLLKILRAVVPVWRPIGGTLHRVPKIGYALSQVLPIACYATVFPQLPRQHQVELEIMDTFDMLAPAYDQPQTLATLKAWYAEAGLALLWAGLAVNGPFAAVGRKPR